MLRERPPDSDLVHEATHEAELHERTRHFLERPPLDEESRARLRGLLARLASRRSAGDVDLIQECADAPRLTPELRAAAVGVLLQMGYPHALRVTPEQLAEYRREVRRRTRPSGWFGAAAVAQGAMVAFTQNENPVVNGTAAAILAGLATIALASPTSSLRSVGRFFAGLGGWLQIGLGGLPLLLAILLGGLGIDDGVPGRGVFLELLALIAAGAGAIAVLRRDARRLVEDSGVDGERTPGRLVGEQLRGQLEALRPRSR